MVNHGEKLSCLHTYKIMLIRHYIFMLLAILMCKYDDFELITCFGILSYVFYHSLRATLIYYNEHVFVH